MVVLRCACFRAVVVGLAASAAVGARQEDSEADLQQVVPPGATVATRVSLPTAATNAAVSRSNAGQHAAAAPAMFRGRPGAVGKRQVLSLNGRQQVAAREQRGQVQARSNAGGAGASSSSIVSPGLHTLVQDAGRDAGASDQPSLDVDLAATQVIENWKAKAAEAKDNAKDEKLQKKMHGAQAILSAMSDDIAAGIVKKTFALVPAPAGREVSVEDVQALAMATVSYGREYDDLGTLADLAAQHDLSPEAPEGQVPTVDITNLVAAPGGHRKGVGAELIRRIVSWAHSENRLVTITPANDGLQEYYESLGFQDMDFSSSMVYSESELDDPLNDLSMVTLS